MKITLLLINFIFLCACNSRLNNAAEGENGKTESEKHLNRSTSLNNSLGKGIMELALRTINYYHQDFLVFRTDSTENIVELHDQPGWNLKINYRDYTRFITAFNSPAFSHHYQFIWLSGEQDDEEIIIKSYGDKRSYRVSNPGRFTLIPWENYLMDRYIALEPEVEIFRKANRRARKSSLDRNAFFKVASVQGPWIQIYAISDTEKGKRPGGRETAWVQWHTNGKLHIRFLNDLELDTHFE